VDSIVSSSVYAYTQDNARRNLYRIPIMSRFSDRHLF